MTKVILVRDVKGLGQIGKVVNVSDGYARNFLIAKNLGKLATADALKQIHEAEIANERTMEKSIAKEAAQLRALSAQVIEFAVKADEDGHLYAGLKESEILDRINLRSASLLDYVPIKKTGEHLVTVILISRKISLKVRINSSNHGQKNK